MLLYFGLVFGDRISLCNPSFPGTHSVDQVSIKHGDLPVCASQVLGLKVYATSAYKALNLKKKFWVSVEGAAGLFPWHPAACMASFTPK